jgi:hypothetical protein
MLHNNKISEKEKQLIIARLEVLSPELYFSSGSDNHTFSRDEMIVQVESGSDVGKKFIAMELEFLRAIKDGSLMKRLLL